MHIDAGIPWEPGKRLGEAVNRFMAKVDHWGLILDWDVHLLNVHWYDLCLDAIRRAGPQAGLITCVTNRIGCPLQRVKGAPDSDSRDEHADFAMHYEMEHAGELEDITHQSRWKLSGFFFLTSREAFDVVGPAPANKFIGFDNWYHDRLREAGYGIYIMRNLYCFHAYRRQWKKPSGGSE